MNDDKLMQEIIERIKVRRKELGLSYQDLANKTGMSKSTLQRYETGYIKNMPLDKVEILANALLVEPGYLMGWENDTKESELSPRAERDIQKSLSKTLDMLENSQDALMFDGEPIDDETRDLLKLSLENSMRLAKKIAKEKYTPKKYKK